MRAALFYGGHDIRVEEVPTPVPGAGEVLVKVAAAGICGSDLHGYRDASILWPGQERPFLNGHELAGTVAAMGTGVQGLQIGQRVAVEPRHLISCGHCIWCRRGDYQMCPSLGLRDGRHIYSSGFAEYSLEAADKCYPLPDAVPMREAAILDVLAVAVHAAHRLPLNPQMTVTVIGAGAIGLATAQMARSMGARQVIMVGTRDAPLAVARELGCDAVVNGRRDDPQAAVMDLTAGRGADVVFETVGGRANTIMEAVGLVSRCGSIGIIGTFIGEVPFTPMAAQFKEASIVWIYSYGRWQGVPEFTIAMDMLLDGRFRAAPMITHEVPLERIAEGFAAADDKAGSGAIKVIVLP